MCYSYNQFLLYNIILRFVQNNNHTDNRNFPRKYKASIVAFLPGASSFTKMNLIYYSTLLLVTAPR